MTTPHIHAAALRALAEGKKLQWKYIDSGDYWCDLCDSHFLKLLAEGDKNLVFRERPPVHQYRVALYVHPSTGATTVTADDADDAFDCEKERYFSRWLTDWIEYEETV